MQFSEHNNTIIQNENIIDMPTEHTDGKSGLSCVRNIQKHTVYCTVQYCKKSKVFSADTVDDIISLATLYGQYRSQVVISYYPFKRKL